MMRIHTSYNEARPGFDDYYRVAFEEIKGKILREPEETILGTDLDELTDYFLQEYIFDPVELVPEGTTMDHQKYVRTVRAHEREPFYQSSGDVDWECERIIIEMQIEPNERITEIASLQSSAHSLSYSESSFSFNRNSLSFSIQAIDYGLSYNEDKIAKSIEENLKRANDLIRWKNADISKGNSLLREQVRKFLEERRTKLKSEEGKVDALTKKINLPLKKKENLPEQRIILSEKKVVKKIKPAPSLPEEYVLDPAKVLDIIAYLDNQGRQFEKAPSSYSGMGEEALRDVLLVSLNAIFEGRATGETFSKKGKTDIHLNIDKGSILVFECKIWGGQKLHHETIDQIRGYLTWRHNFGVIIGFVRSKNFSAILESIPDVIQASPSYVDGIKKVGDSHFVSNHRLEDEGKEVEIHHLFYHLPSV